MVTDQGKVNSNKCNTAELGWKIKRLPKCLAGLLMRSRSELLLNTHVPDNGCTSVPKSPPGCLSFLISFQTLLWKLHSGILFPAHQRSYSSLPLALPFFLNFQQRQKPFLCYRARYLATLGLGWGQGLTTHCSGTVGVHCPRWTQHSLLLDTKERWAYTT